MLRPVLKFYFWSMKMQTNNEGLQRSPGSSNSEPSLCHSPSSQQDAESEITHAGQVKQQTEFTCFDNVVISKSPLNCLASLSPTKVPPPRSVLFLSFSLKPVKLAWTQNSAPLTFLRTVPHSCCTSQPSLFPRKPILLRFVCKPHFTFVESYLKPLRTVSREN